MTIDEQGTPNKEVPELETKNEKRGTFLLTYSSHA